MTSQSETAPSIDQTGLCLSDSPAPLRLGCVSYLNTLPLIEGLAKLRDLRLTLTAPSRLVNLLLAREVDLALVSLIDYQRSPEPLVMLPVGMIGCDGPTLTVRLFSRVPIERLSAIHADTDSHTSIALLRIILARRFAMTGRRLPPIIDFDVDAHRASGARNADWPQAMLLIGDKVIADAPPASLYPHQLDLGTEWKTLTGLPFVYAVWMCRAEDAERPAIATAASVLDRQRRRNAVRLSWIVDARAPVRGWPADEARHYLSDLLRFEVDSAAVAAIDRFFELAVDCGIIADRRPARWAGEASV